MHEHDETDPLEILEGIQLTPATFPDQGTKKIRGCLFGRANKGHWALIVQGVRWDFVTLPKRQLSRRGIDISSPHVACLDDAALFALGYEQGALVSGQNSGGTA